MAWNIFKKTASIIGLLAVALVLIQTMHTTYQLAQIDQGLKTSLDSTGQLITIQHAIIQKNNSLQDVVATTKQMDTALNDTLQTTQHIETHIHTINDLNTATLQLNKQMTVLGEESGSSLGDIASGMGQLQQSSTALYNALSKLNGYVNQDRNGLDHMKTDTDHMNQKLPGVLK